MDYFLFLTPFLIYQLSPLAALVAILATLGIMSKNNEIVACKASGISLYRLAVPLLLAGLALAGSMIILDDTFLPYANQRQDALRNQIKGRPTQTYKQPESTKSCRSCSPRRVERSRIRRLPISMWSVIRSRRPRTSLRCFAAYAPSVLSATTIRSIAGRWTTITALPRFFAQVGRKAGEDYREVIVYDRGGGDVKHPVGGRTMPPKFLGGTAPTIAAGKDRREILGQWLTSPENPFFATSVANRIWAHFFGAGIIEPVDDIRVSNPPSNPELFQSLGAKLTEYKFDFKSLVRDICNSEAYQRSCERNESNAADERNFAHAAARRIPAEQLLDCIGEVTGAPDKFQGLPLGARAVQIADGANRNYFLTTFGRAPRDTVCACEAKTEPTLSQALHMLNGNTIQGKVQQGGAIKKLLDAKKQPTEVIETLYVRCFLAAADQRRNRRLAGNCEVCAERSARTRRRFLGRSELTRVPL